MAAGVIVADHLTAEWQGALWVALAVAGAKLIWASLTGDQQGKVLAMATGEANRFLTYVPPYTRNASGRVINEGDTKAEEKRVAGVGSVPRGRPHADPCRPMPTRPRG